MRMPNMTAEASLGPSPFRYTASSLGGFAAGGVSPARSSTYPIKLGGWGNELCWGACIIICLRGGGGFDMCSMMCDGICDTDHDAPVA